MPNHLVSIGLVTWNSAAHLPGCLGALARQEYTNFELIVVDNDSADDSLELVLRHYPNAKVIRNNVNTGFCHAHNQAIRASKGIYYMPLNPDVFLMPDFLLQMTRAIELDKTVGQVSGKLYRISDVAEVGNSRILDSVGMFFTPNQRHFDRGAGEMDVGQYDRLEYIFGVSGAAAFYRRAALEDVSIDGEFFDENFFAYREDADISWRMQLMGWKALYTPRARAYHVRSLRGDARRMDVDKNINMHSVKNRFLMRIKNQTWKNGIRFFLPVFWRDLMVAGYVVLFEHSSLPAFLLLLRTCPETLRKRQAVMNKRRVSDYYIGQWFNWKAAAFDLEENK
ncbi:MAG: glycosyltransferase family 2 protein [Chloroflexi bacterium]|nr:glycosyltransferase family 2 protein [Chloroflexota bacterium]